MNSHCPLVKSQYEYKGPKKALPVLVLDDADYVLTDVLPPICAFGGFRPGPYPKTDFILLAECSEVSGPNPIYTIPRQQRLVNDLNILCVKLLSADYQEFGCQKTMVNSHTQLLVPDVMKDIHVAINHFRLYDAEARGFIRPLSIAYVTTDKHKLMLLSKQILRNLSKAANLIQISNVKFCQKGFEHLLQDLAFTKSNLSSCDDLLNDCDNPEERMKVYSNFIDSCIKDVNQILSSIRNMKVCEKSGTLVQDFYHQLSEKFASKTLVPDEKVDEAVYEPILLKVPIQQNFDKRLRNLVTISPDGIFIALYHLNLVYRHFCKRYEDIFTHEEPNPKDQLGVPLLFGACVKTVTTMNDIQVENNCCLKMANFSHPIINFEDKEYLTQFNRSFFEIIFDFLKSQNSEKLNGICKLASPDLDPSDKSSQLSPSSTEGENDRDDGNEIYDSNNCKRHILTLDTIWDALNCLSYHYPDAQYVTLRVLKSVGRVENLLLALLSHSLIAILYSVEEEPFVKIFAHVLAALTPQSKNQKMCVLHHVGKPHRLKETSNISVVTFPMPCRLFEYIPGDLSQLAILDLTTASFSGPSYKGCLLEGVSEHLRKLSAQDPVFPFLISTLSEVELQVQLWKPLASSSSSSATMYLLQKGLTRFDIKIIEVLASLCC